MEQILSPETALGGPLITIEEGVLVCGGLEFALSTLVRSLGSMERMATCSEPPPPPISGQGLLLFKLFIQKGCHLLVSETCRGTILQIGIGARARACVVPAPIANPYAKWCWGGRHWWDPGTIETDTSSRTCSCGEHAWKPSSQPPLVPSTAAPVCYH